MYPFHHTHPPQQNTQVYTHVMGEPTNTSPWKYTPVVMFTGAFLHASIWAIVGVVVFHAVSPPADIFPDVTDSTQTGAVLSVNSSTPGYVEWTKLTYDYLFPETEFRYDLASGENGGVLFSAIWNVRKLNVFHNYGGTNFTFNDADDEITVPPGVYKVMIYVASYDSRESTIRLYDTTHASSLASDVMKHKEITDDQSMFVQHIDTRLTFVNTSTVRLEQKVELTQSPDGQGYPGLHGEGTTTVIIRFTKIG